MTDGDTALTVIRRLLPTDRAAWELLWQANLRHFQADETAYRAIPIIWQRLMDQDAPLLGWLIGFDDRPAGLAHVVLRFHTFSAAPVAILEDLWIADFARRRGLARALIAQLADAGRELGWKRIEWETGTGNLAARRLYDTVATPVSVKRYQIELG